MKIAGSNCLLCISHEAPFIFVPCTYLKISFRENRISAPYHLQFFFVGLVKLVDKLVGVNCRLTP